MSTQPIDRRRLPAIRRRRPDTSRLLAVGAVFAAVFAGAFLIGHTRAGTGALAERLPPSLPTLATPVPTALSSAPPIEVATRPVAPQAPIEAAKAPGSAATTATTTTQLAPAATPTATPPKTVTAPASTAPKAPVSGGSPSPSGSHSSGSGSSHGGSGGGQGTSFDSSG